MSGEIWLRIYPKIPPNRGGMENHIYEITKVQRAGGVRVLLFYLSGTGLDPDDVCLCRTEREKIQKLDVLMFFVRIKKYLDHANLKPTVIHLHGDWLHFLLGGIFLRKFNAKIIGSFHGSVIHKKKILYKVAYRNLSHLFCNGRREVDFFDSLLAIPCHFRPSGIKNRLQQLSKSLGPRSIDFLSVGSLIPVKNYQLLFEVAERLPEYNFVILGDGPQFESLCKKTELCSNVFLLGHQDVSTSSAIMAESKILLHTSFAEGTPTVFYEAAAHGMEIVTTPSNSYAEIAGLTDFVHLAEYSATDFAERARLACNQYTPSKADADQWDWAEVVRDIEEKLKN